MPLSAGAIAGLGLAGDVIGGLFGKSGQSSANKANLRIARENRQWQEMMSNSAYQRSAKDLEKAGLNRILAIGQPASTPAGNIATMQNENAPLQAGIGKGINSAMALATMKANIANINARTELTNAQKKAIAPAAGLGEGVGGAIEFSKEQLRNLDWLSMADRFGQDVKGVATAAKEGIKNIGQNGVNNYEMAKTKIRKMSEEMNLVSPDKLEQELRAVVDQMDAPKGMNNKQKLIWAMNHIDEIARFRNRQIQGK